MTQREEGIAYRLEQVKSTLTAVCIRRQSTVELVAVSKTFPAEAVLEVAREVFAPEQRSRLEYEGLA